MSHSRKHLLRAIAPVAVLALALTGCGGDEEDGTGGGKGESTASESPAEESASPDADEADDSGSDNSAGGELKLGQTAPEKSVERGDGEATLKITAEKVDKGVNADLIAAGFDGEKVKGKYPVYAYLKYEMVGLTGEVPDGTDFNSTAAVLDTEGKPGARFIAIGGSPLKGGCPEKDRELKWEKGTTATQCTTFLMPEGKEIDKVAWGIVNPLLWSIN